MVRSQNVHRNFFFLKFRSVERTLWPRGMVLPNPPPPRTPLGYGPVFSQTFSLALHSTTEFFAFQQSFLLNTTFRPENSAFFGYTSKLSKQTHLYIFFFVAMSRCCYELPEIVLKNILKLFGMYPSSLHRREYTTWFLWRAIFSKHLPYASCSI